MNIIQKNTAVIILAAGKGTRMKSNRAKVLHEILGRPMISYVVDTSKKISHDNTIVVIGHQAEEVKKIILNEFSVDFALQKEQLGTGHAVQSAMSQLAENIERVVVLCGDVPLISTETIEALIDKQIQDQCEISMLAVELDDPTGYGRVVVDSQGNVTNIIEEADADLSQKAIKTVNAGIYCIKKEYLKSSLERIKANNAQGEYYLTDIIEICNKDGKKIGLIISDNLNEVIGINDKKALKTVEEIMVADQGIS